MSLFIIKQILILVSIKGYHRINTENGKKEESREEECLYWGVRVNRLKKKKISGCVQNRYKRQLRFCFSWLLCHDFSQRPLATDIRKKE